jgi:hypothetical protein
MTIVALDPGETIGVAYLNADGELYRADHIEVEFLEGSQVDFSNLNAMLNLTLDLSYTFESYQEIEAIVLEDYRVYGSKADVHIGSRVITSEIIGAIELLAAQEHHEVVRISATTKGRWPIARLKRWYPEQYKSIIKPHGLDAWILGLCYLELWKDWNPKEAK